MELINGVKIALLNLTMQKISNIRNVCVGRPDQLLELRAVQRQFGVKTAQINQKILKIFSLKNVYVVYQFRRLVLQEQQTLYGVENAQKSHLVLKMLLTEDVYQHGVLHMLEVIDIKAIVYHVSLIFFLQKKFYVITKQKSVYW